MSAVHPDLEPLGHPIIGDSLALGFQADGENNRIITRRYRCKVANQPKHIVRLIKPELTDPQIPTAYIVDQDVGSANATDCIITRVFAEIPTEWDDYSDQFVDFIGVQRPQQGGTEMLWRESPISLPVVVRINRRYFLSNPQKIPRIARFSVIDQLGNRMSTASAVTTPSNEEYAAMVLSGQEICTTCRVSRWKGDIWVRETYWARAQ